MNKSITFSFSICIFLCSSCAFHSGTFESSAAIANNQFRIVGTANGYAEKIQIFGFGGFNKDALVYEAKKDLYAKYPLAKGMALANATVDFKVSFLPFVRTTGVIIRADIIDFNPTTVNATYKSFYTEDSTFFPARDLFIQRTNAFTTDFKGDKIKVSDEVTFTVDEDFISGSILFINSFGIKCQYETPQGILKKIYLLPGILF